MAKKISAILIISLSLCLLCIMLGLVSCKSAETLSVVYDIGEFGTTDSPISQRVSNKKDIIVPTIIAKQGYIFTGFLPEVLPDYGDVKVKAQYCKIDTFLVDNVGREFPIDYSVDMLQGLITTGYYPIAPLIALRLENLQTGVFSVDYIAPTLDDIQHIVMPDKPDDLPHVEIENMNEYVAFQYYAEESCYRFSPFESSLFDWETVLTIKFFYSSNKYLVSTILIPIKWGHVKTTSIMIDKFTAFGIENEEPYITTDQIKPLDKIELDGIISYESDCFSGNAIFSDFKGYISRIWSENGDEIAVEYFDEYAYFINGGYILQTTDKLSNAWRIEVYVIDERDGITSNTYTLYIS